MFIKKLLISFLIFLPIYSWSQVRIMPLGNSITMGRHGEPGGYRDDLAHMLLDAGINFTMVGSRNDGSHFYPYHEGHSGWRADEILAELNGWLNRNPADIVLLHIGTNDISQGQSNDTTILEIEDILDLIHTKNRNTIILLCSLIPRFDYYQNRPQRTEQLNELIFSLFLTKNAQGWPIYFVDQNSAFKQNPNWQTEWMDDYVHPNDAGYHVMAQTFYDVLYPILSGQQYHIAGTIFYYANSQIINGVNLSLSGETADSQLSDENGNYRFENLSPNGNYLVTPHFSKISRYENNWITMYNAALTLRHAVGLDLLNSEQQIAADVDKNGVINAYDAALIARYVVELDMLPDDHVGEWAFLPQSRSYVSLNQNITNADFSAVLLGDVAGAWQANPLYRLSTEKYPMKYEIVVNDENRFVLQLQIQADSLLSFLTELNYDTKDMILSNIKSLSNLPLMTHEIPGRLKLGFYSAHFINGESASIQIEFKRKNSESFDPRLKMKFQINEFNYESEITNLNVERAATENYFTLKENYPNPFNPHTNISLFIHKQGYLNAQIYNLLGQEIKTLFRGPIDEGNHRIIWDGTDESGTTVASGIYVCRVRMANKMKTIKLTKSE